MGSLSLGGCTAAEGDDHANKMLYIAPTRIIRGGAKSEIGIKDWAAQDPSNSSNGTPCGSVVLLKEGSLPVKEQRAVQAHVNGCVRCRRELDR